MARGLITYLDTKGGAMPNMPPEKQRQVARGLITRHAQTPTMCPTGSSLRRQNVRRPPNETSRAPAPLPQVAQPLSRRSTAIDRSAASSPRTPHEAVLQTPVPNPSGANSRKHALPKARAGRGEAPAATPPSRSPPSPVPNPQLLPQQDSGQASAPPQHALTPAARGDPAPDRPLNAQAPRAGSPHGAQDSRS